MQREYRVITLCGSTRFKDKFMEIQERFTLTGNIVISVGQFAHDSDGEEWKEMNDGTGTSISQMLDDMQKSKIDMADSIFIVNQDGYIGESTWSEICYASMLGKTIDSLEPIDSYEISERVAQHIHEAQRLAYQQYDAWTHLYTDYPDPNILLNNMVLIKTGKYTTVDPWIPDDEVVSTEKMKEFDPFKKYGKKKMARFVEDILAKERADKEQARLYNIGVRN